jgi:acetylornithine/N-succinyldiaminopimelate aminotransferase
MAKKMAEILEQGKSLLIGNYSRIPLVLERGEGSIVHDTDGRRYIDLFAGFGGTILGHCHPELVAAAARQAGLLWHVGNTFYTEPQIEVAQWLNRTAFTGKSFFCHSGLEANEAACKLARLRGKPRGRWKIISFHQSFHGRSLAMIAATGNPKTRAGFEPTVPGFIQVEPGNIEALRAVVDAQTAGIIMEPIQGEGGINLYPTEFPAQVRRLCDELGLTLIFDEVWTGCGRTGRWFGYQHFTDESGGPVVPDVITLAKAVGGGLPVGVMHAGPEVAAVLVPGTHGCTLGANPICMSVAAKVFEVIERDRLLEYATQLGELAKARLGKEPRLAGKVAAVRGRGLMLGIEMTQPPERVVEKGLELGVILNLTAQKVVRLAPALDIPRGLFEEGLDKVVDTLASA